jgi:DNA invertase Pin-like site-specific DNA recombinase
MQVLTFLDVSGTVCLGVRMKPKMTPAVRAYFQAITSMGGKARAAKYPYHQLSEWASHGGRPRAIDEKQAVELAQVLKRGISQKECAERLGCSLSSVVRTMKRLRERGIIA